MPRAELLELSAEGLGPIGSARIEFGPGFNVLTGETGGGKTLLVGALNLCVGGSDGRTSRGPGMRTVAVFRDGDGEVALGRQIVAGGRLRGTIDEAPTSAEGLRARAGNLVAIHGQHDSMRLRSRSEALRLLDGHGGIDDRALREVRRRRRLIDEQRSGFGGDPAQREREVEFLRFQLDEFDRVAPSSPDELDNVLEELRELTEIRENHRDLMAAVDEMEGDDEESVLARWSRAIRGVPDVGAVGAARRRLSDMVGEARDLVRDIGRAIESAQVDEAEFGRLEVRVAELQALSRKHGGTLPEALARREEMAKDLAAREQAAAELATADEELERLATQEAELGAELLEARCEAAQSLATAVGANFARVALEGASLVVAVGGPDGSDVELLFSSSAELEPGPIQSLASGGELSRVMLALSLESVADGVVAVFDEVDAGVGGAVAQQIGECLAELAKEQQVIAVTHLASVAARASHHFVVERSSHGGVSSTTVREVEGEDRVAEVARMLAGERDLKESRALAERLLTGP
jgi:DNA repair protein RecN (Recombination protein N)